MSGLQLHDLERATNPLDVLEQIVAANEWAFERRSDSEMAAEAPGKWCDYGLYFSWSHEISAMSFSCAFDLKVPDRRRLEILQLVSRINEQLWVGHFDLWSSENVVMFRHSLILAGGAEPTHAQCETMLRVAVEACERYFQAFQFVMWAGKTAREALDSVLFETEGEA
jgi:hypothetical protein